MRGGFGDSRIDLLAAFKLPPWDKSRARSWSGCRERRPFQVTTSPVFDGPSNVRERTRGQGQRSEESTLSRQQRSQPEAKSPIWSYFFEGGSGVNGGGRFFTQTLAWIIRVAWRTRGRRVEITWGCCRADGVRRGGGIFKTASTQQSFMQADVGFMTGD